MKCRQCGKPALGVNDEGYAYQYCDSCLDILIERSQQRAEWEQFHDEPCPGVELTPLPIKEEAIS